MSKEKRKNRRPAVPGKYYDCITPSGIGGQLFRIYWLHKNGYSSGAAEGVCYLVFSSIGSDGVFWAMLLWRLISCYGFIAVGGLIYGFRALHLRHHAKRKEL